MLPAVVIGDPQRQRLNKRTPSEEDIETSVALTARVIKQTVIDARCVAINHLPVGGFNTVALCLKACLLALAVLVIQLMLLIDPHDLSFTDIAMHCNYTIKSCAVTHASKSLLIHAAGSPRNQHNRY